MMTLVYCIVTILGVAIQTRFLPLRVTYLVWIVSKHTYKDLVCCTVTIGKYRSETRRTGVACTNERESESVAGNTFATQVPTRTTTYVPPLHGTLCLPYN